MRVVLAGASGLIGSALRQALRAQGHAVTSLVRTPPAGPDERRWWPERGELDPAVLADADAVVCLSGAGIGEHRWTAAYKRTLLQSRLVTVGTLAETIVAAGAPRVFLSASAVGFYGDTGDRVVDETAPPGAGFLADLCRQWEAAAEPAGRAGTRVTRLRTGLVLTGAGGLVKRLRPIVRAGVGGRLGDGRQYMPWISLTDEIAAICHLLENDVPGPVNLTGPAPVTNAEFVETLGRILHRPTVLPVPRFALRLALGELAGDALSGQRAVPARLQDSGFTFAHTDVESALRWALGR